MDNLEQRLDDFERRLNELVDTVNGSFLTDGLERRLDEPENKAEGRGGLEGDVEELKRDFKDLKRGINRL